MNSRWSPDSSTNDTTADSPVGVSAARRGQPRVVEPHRDLGGEVLEQVARQPELREDDEPGALAASAARSARGGAEVRVEQAEPRRDLGERDPQRLHERSIAVAAAAPGERKGP